MNKKVLLVFFAIIIIASFLRLWQLGNVPPSPDWDEAALGYNAYSIIQTGKDEYGKFLPVVFRSYDDYKPGLYVYLSIPSILVFGLNTFAIRLPSAIFGILTVVATYFLVSELFKRREVGRASPKALTAARNGKMEADVGNERKKSHFSFQGQASHIALLASFLLAISPWHLQFARIAFESNVGVALNLFGALFFVKGLRKPWLLTLSAVFMLLALYVYQSEKVFTPLLALSMVVIFRKNLLALPKRYILVAVLVGLVVSLPIVKFTLTNKEALARAQGVSVFSDSGELIEANAHKLLVDKERGDYLGIVFDNRRVTFLKETISGYISHFDLNWLFINGDLPRHHAPNMGLLYIFELPFLLIGMFTVMFGNFPKVFKLFVLAWFLITPIPASITSGVPHAVRTLNFVPIIHIFTAVGMIAAISNIKYQISNTQIKYLIFTLFALFFMFNFFYFLNQYFIQQNYFNSKEWQYGYEEAVSEVREIEKNYDKIIVSNRPYMDQSYMFFLFYLKYPPKEYQKNSQYASGGFAENHKFGKYEFRPIVWNSEEKSPQTLYVGLASDFPPNAKIIKKINFLDGSPAISIVEG